jgi:hypothetical protein
MHAHSPRALSPREPELPFMRHWRRININPKFVSWVADGARLGKAQVRKWGRWWRPLGIDLVICKSEYLFRVFDSRTLYFILYYYFLRFYISGLFAISCHSCRCFLKHAQNIITVIYIKLLYCI